MSENIHHPKPLFILLKILVQRASYLFKNSPSSIQNLQSTNQMWKCLNYGGDPTLCTSYVTKIKSSGSLP